MILLTLTIVDSWDDPLKNIEMQLIVNVFII